MVEKAPEAQSEPGGVLVLVRHGQTEWNASGRFSGWADVSLNDRGRREAKAMGELLAEHDFYPADAYSSRLERARETLDAADQFGAEQVKNWRRGFAVRPPEMHESHPWHELIYDGGTYDDVGDGVVLPTASPSRTARSAARESFAGIAAFLACSAPPPVDGKRELGDDAALADAHATYRDAVDDDAAPRARRSRCAD
ncbi:histidine phosphatase [Aureococcus anophagefferens]|uniref:phosphoglycerate mutase (2,3-diphosphoglycerate-dependent) n=1 Tax=Aureococcus anophagefferens TaxID=44056 RepID=A0ABR1FI00_AURAN